MRCRQTRALSARLFSALTAATVLFALGGCGSQSSSDAPDVQPVTTGDTGGSTGGGGGGGGGAGQPTATLGDPSPATLTAGVGSSTITATVTTAAGAQAPDGTIVTFVVSPTTIAAADDTTVATIGGQAQAVLRGRRAGAATVVAKALGATSTSKSLTVLGPQVTISADVATIGASAPGTAGAVITVTARDQQGNPMAGLSPTFSASLGSLTPVTSPAAGEYQVTLTSQTVGTALVSASVLGTTTDTVAVTVSAGPVASLTLTPNPSQIRKGLDETGTSEIAIEAQDEFGNAAGGVAVTVESAPGAVGTLDGSLVTLDASGRGSVTFTSGPGQFGTATVTATADGVVETATILSAEDRVGEPANILLSVAPEDGRITVKGVGSNERATITARVIDVEGNPIDDSAVTSNIEFQITKAPGNTAEERPSLDGQDAFGVLTLTTSGGVVSANLQSGTRPGTVEIAVRVTRGKDGGPLPGGALSAIVPQITIESGPAASLFLSPSNAVQSNGDGTITHEYFAVLSDLYGNAVPDGTSVFFGQFLNILDECRTIPPVDNQSLVFAEIFVPGVGFVPKTCADGILGADGTVSAASGNFGAVAPGDTWVAISKDNPLGIGGYIVDAVNSGQQLSLETVFDFGANGLEWAVGNNKNLGGAVFTPGTVVPTQGGIARWPNTYSGELVNRAAYIYAETGGKGLGHARWFHLRGVAPLRIEINGPSEMPANSTACYALDFTDGSGPTPYWIPDLLANVTVNGGLLSDGGFPRAFEQSAGLLWLLSTSREPTVDYAGGQAGFCWTTPAAADGARFKIQVSGGGITQPLEVTIRN